eukprot:scaffold236232_cov24-Tisochrysis_lutea.AAC.2
MFAASAAPFVGLGRLSLGLRASRTLPSGVLPPLAGAGVAAAAARAARARAGARTGTAATAAAVTVGVGCGAPATDARTSTAPPLFCLSLPGLSMPCHGLDLSRGRFSILSLFPSRGSRT